MNKFTVDPDELRPLFDINPYRHAASMLGNWAIIAGSIFLCLSFLRGFMYF
ncbi:MAG: hypothetical protein R2788_12735 [Saprospiraceae bacterium]